ncbi:MAG: sensor histidine kinase [Hyphomicrobium sp.]
MYKTKKSSDFTTEDRKPHPTISKLASIPTYPVKDTDYDLLAMFCRNKIDAGLTMPAMAIIFAIASMFWAPIEHAILWVMFVFFSKFVLLNNCRKYLNIPRSKINVLRWKSRLITAEGFSGIAWASFAFVGLWNQNETTSTVFFSSHVFLFATLIAHLGIRMSLASTVIGILYAGTLPFTLTVTIRFILLNDPFYFALASMAAGLNIYFIFLAQGLHATAVRMLEYRYQKNELIKKLENSRVRAEEANTAKSQFLATMSHELRTPLNGIMGFSEMIMSEAMGKVSNPNYVEYAKNIHESGLHLLSLINDILDLSRIEAGRYELHEEAFWLCDVADDCRSFMRIKAKNKGISFLLNDDRSLPQIFADQRAFRQIFLNLIENAIKFTPEGGRIILTTGKTFDGAQYFSVKDTGPGIAHEEIPKILEPFKQGSSSLNSTNSGSGLGLAIVKKLVELHSGVFEILSESGKGTEAIVVVPKNRILHPVSQSQKETSDKNEKPYETWEQQSLPIKNIAKNNQITLAH